MAGQHAHHWTEASRHRTSQGWVVYRRCACRMWQIVTEPGRQVWLGGGPPGGVLPQRQRPPGEPTIEAPAMRR
nr:hypothetical protein [Microbispora rosea]